MFELTVKFCFLILFINSVLSVKLDRPTNPKKDDTKKDGTSIDLKEGDIVEDVGSRNAISNSRNLWPGNVIPMTIDSQYPHDVNLIERALDHIEAQTCLKFKQRTNEDDYVTIFSGEGCYSHVGRIGGEQKLSLHAGCQNFGTVLHEIMHAIGFYHAHNRSDRDKYMRIHWNNIQQPQRHNFKLLSPEENLLFFPNNFDFQSVMLYGPTAFSKDGKSITMSPIHPVKFTTVRAKTKLSREDVLAMNYLYKCKKAKPVGRTVVPNTYVQQPPSQPIYREVNNHIYPFNPFQLQYRPFYQLF